MGSAVNFYGPGTGGTKTEVGPLYSWVLDILPYIGNEQEYNSWDRTLRYQSPTVNTGNNPSNYTISQVDIGILRCPEDLTVQASQGNLSYVVNGGFARWSFLPTYGWTVDKTTLIGSADTLGTNWSPSTPANNPAIARKMGVLHPGTYGGNLPWDYKSTLSSVVDGLSTTVLASENLLAGYSTWDTSLMGTAPTAAASRLFAGDELGHPPPQLRGLHRLGQDLQTPPAVTARRGMPSGPSPPTPTRPAPSRSTASAGRRPTASSSASISTSARPSPPRATPPTPAARTAAASTSCSATARSASSRSRSTAPSTPRS